MKGIKGIVVYRTRHGSTESFARWISEATGFPAVRVEDFKEDSSAYDRMILGCSVHRRRVALADWIVDRWPTISAKKPILFLTSGAPRAAKPFFDRVLSESLPEGIRKSLPVFPVGGRYLFSEMGSFERFMVKLAAALNRDPAVKRGMLTEIDDVRKENLEGLLSRLAEEGIKS